MFSIKSFFSSLIIALSLMTSSSSVLGKEREVQLNFDGCMLMAQLVESLSSEKTTVSKKDQIALMESIISGPDQRAVVRKVIGLVYDHGASSGEEFLNFCVKNQGRMMIEEEKDV